MVGGEPDGSLWTFDRRQLQAAIAEKDRLLADLYGRAIDSLSERPITAVALVIAGHCIRDLVNGLADALTEKGVIPKYENVGKPAQELSDQWAKHETRLEHFALPISEDGETTPEASTSVPWGLFVAASRVVVGSRLASGNSRRRYAALILGRIEADGEKDPTVTLFKKCVDTFEKKRHPSRDREVVVDDTALAELQQALQTIESVLEGRLGSFLEALEDVFDVIDAANRREDIDE